MSSEIALHVHTIASHTQMYLASTVDTAWQTVPNIIRFYWHYVNPWIVTQLEQDGQGTTDDNCIIDIYWEQDP